MGSVVDWRMGTFPSQPPQLNSVSMCSSDVSFGAVGGGIAASLFHSRSILQVKANGARLGHGGRHGRVVGALVFGRS